jgi:chemotaxis signal transduction protein
VSGWLLGAREDVPVWSLARLLGRPEGRAARGDRAVLMVPAAGGGGRFGLLVDRVESFEAPPRGAHPLPAPFVLARVAGFHGVVRTADGLLLRLDPQALRPDRPSCDHVAASAPEEPAVSPEEAFAGGAAAYLQYGRGIGRVLIAELLAESADGRRISLALSAAQVREVVGAQEIVPVPGAPDHLPGLVLWRDRPLPVLDLARLVAGPDRPSPSALPASRFVVASAGTEEIALPVGRDVRFERLPLPARPLRLPPELRIAEVLGGYDLAGSLLLVFDIARSLAGTDRDRPVPSPSALDL